MFYPSPQDLTGNLSLFESRALVLDDPRPHPSEPALLHLGQAVMTELIDVVAETALEDFQAIICEALIGAFHSAAQRIEREADRSRDVLNRLVRDFDGSEIADTEMQAATVKANSADVATLAVEMVRDAAAQAYTVATGEVWSPWRGSVKASRTTAAQIEAREALRQMKGRRAGALDPGRVVVAFRAAPQADTAVDAGRIFDALNWAHREWPDMALATTGAKGGEKIAMKWATAKKVPLIMAKPDFDRHGRAAPFRANDDLLALEPVCILTLANTLDAARSGFQPFGPALNLGQKADQAGVRHQAVRMR